MKDMKMDKMKIKEDKKDGKMPKKDLIKKDSLMKKGDKKSAY